MRWQPTALGWIDPDVSSSPEWDAARLLRFARRLGYELLWREESAVRVVDQVRALDVDVVLIPAPNHLSALEFDSIMHLCGIETLCPRMSFDRWADIETVRSGR
ncbi:hypothetical protein [Nocardia wallacei]|uniref:hypothetical protein n=1 Tax=Nocardia wallacei TaxID=480035 RepID=UPI002454F036|nr:hypothetical protein [Nocardia wallacei]